MDEHDDHPSATLSLAERTTDGGMVFQSWEICACTLSQLRAQLGTPGSQALATAEQVEATGRAVLSVDGVARIGEGL